MNAETLQYGKSYPFTQGAALKFPDFSITFEGTETSTAPVTVSFVKVNFRIAPNSGAAQRVTITQGQISPKPFEFTTPGRRFELRTFMMPAGERLPPDHLAVFQK